MDYKEALTYIHGTRKLGWKLGLDNIEYLLKLMGNPHKKLKYIHIAGTNGKGSTAAFLSQILIQAGYKVGIFTSPYIEKFTERIKINNCEIDGSRLAEITSFVKDKIESMIADGQNHPTEFEIITAIAIQYYFENMCDIVILEVGLGGRFDSTNIIETPELAIITSISYDHMMYLGNTLEEIAFEKAGIIKESGSVVLYPQKECVKKLIRRICYERNALLSEIDFGPIEMISYGVDGQRFDYDNYKSLDISLLGEHQVKNSIVAIKSAELLNGKGYNIDEKSIREGLKKTKWPGRFQIVKKDPIFIIDGAHNLHGVQVLRSNLDNYFRDKKKILIMGVLRDKDYKSMISTIMPLADKVVLITPNIDRALNARELAMFVKHYCNEVIINDTIEESIETSLRLASPDDVICAFGSLYYIGDVIRYFKKTN